MKVLAFGDPHFPFIHKNYLKFLKDKIDEYQPDRIVCVGDLVDGHTLSRYISDPDGFSAGDEWRKTKEALKELYRIIPECDWVIGNHDRRPYIKAYNHGMPEGLIRPLEDIYDCPPQWKVSPEVEIDNVYYVHGEASGGQSGWQNYCNFLTKSVVFGHLHSVGGVRYHQNFDGDQKFSMCVSCGVDSTAYAFAYGKFNKNQPVLGLGTVTDGWLAQYTPMNMRDRRYRGKKDK